MSEASFEEMSDGEGANINRSPGDNMRIDDLESRVVSLEEIAPAYRIGRTKDDVKELQDDSRRIAMELQNLS